MSLQAACQDYVPGESDLILVGLGEQLDSGSVEDAVQLLLQDKYKSILVDLGWDLLSLLTLRLPVDETDLRWSLVDKIVELGSPKEMCLAVLEQMDSLSMMDKTAAVLNMLSPLQKALLQAPNAAIVTSTLHSVYRLIEKCCPQLTMVERDTDVGDEDIEHSYDNAATEDQIDCNFFAMSNQVLTFIRPFVDRMHVMATQPEVLFPNHKLAVNVLLLDQLRKQKIECLAILLCLLDYPLVSCCYGTEGKTDQVLATRARNVAESIMGLITQCHYGCIHLLSPSPPWPRVGLASFAHLLLVEEIMISYLPVVLSQQFLLSLCLAHVITLLERPETTTVVLKGLALLESAVGRVEKNSLPLVALENKQYINLANVITKVMVSCSDKTARQRSVSLLMRLIHIFTADGRHKLYSHLLHTVCHGGVVGLLVHSVKNEVDTALKGASMLTASPFLGESLGPLLNKIFTLSPDTQLMEEMDRVMAALNFLRYLLIGDTQERNETGVWGIRSHLHTSFVAPVRQLLTSTKMVCRQEMEAAREEKGQRAKDGPEVCVEVAGETLPKLSEKEELQMLEVVGNHMDMLESVLVRVEELLEH
ncbi:glomulin-like isoform X2 [Halichondria panicea]|uniref:glomulin-like isoform X2 n=1 Tax=Halichondria panicea TaxID=6063 RepID=UPI00312B9A93